MASVSLFQKWRSQNFGDLVGQDVVVRTLRNALSSGRPANAYLFCGPRGTGKTSTARILAKALNCEKGPTAEPCGVCSACRKIAEGSCLDVLEIDAASHTQVDKIREFIVEKVQFVPAEVRYKVYIIDEVHKLSAASFNALLKTLEEPPEHVVFILATTHPHELLPTILSRCQRYDFQRFTLKQIVDRVKFVAGQENVAIDDAGAEFIARSAEGSMRDALVGLEQAMTFCGSDIKGEEVRDLLGLVGLEAVQNLVECFIQKDGNQALQILDELVQKGRDLNRLVAELLEYLRQIMLVCVNAADREALGVTDAYFAELQSLAGRAGIGSVIRWITAIDELPSRIQSSGSDRLNWELTLIKLTVPMAGESSKDLQARVEALEGEIAGLKQQIKIMASAPAALRVQSVPSLPAASSLPQSSALPAAQVPAASPAPAPSALQLPSAGVWNLGSADASASSVKEHDDLGWSDPAPSSAAKTAASSSEASAASQSSPAPARKSAKRSSTKEIWNAIIEHIVSSNAELRGCLEGSVCMSAVRGKLTIKYQMEYASQYHLALTRLKELEALASERMKRPIKLEFMLNTPREADADETHEHVVKLAVNNFNGRLIDEYPND